jgi:chromosome segregation ATPase
MPVRRTMSSALFRSIEPRLREWLDANRPAAPAEPDASKLAALEEANARLEKKLSMAMGAIQAATAQIVQLRQELEQATNLARQAMQKATTAQATAESATEGVSTLEAREPAREPARDATREAAREAAREAPAAKPAVAKAAREASPAKPKSRAKPK